MRVTVSDTAKQHLREGYWWYEKQDPGAGDYFLRCLYVEIESLHRLAGIHRKAHGLFRLLTDKFPFAICYYLRADTITVHAVLDLRQHPAKIRQRLNPCHPTLRPQNLGQATLI